MFICFVQPKIANMYKQDVGINENFFWAKLGVESIGFFGPKFLYVFDLSTCSALFVLKHHHVVNRENPYEKFK